MQQGEVVSVEPAVVGWEEGAVGERGSGGVECEIVGTEEGFGKGR